MSLKLKPARSPRKPPKASKTARGHLTHSAFAKLSGRSDARVTQAIREGLVIEDGAGKIDPNLPANRAWMDSRLKAGTNGVGARGRKQDPQDVEKRSDVELRKAIAQAEKIELQNAESRRELIPAEADKRAWAKFYSVLTGELLPLFSKLAPEFAAALGVHDDAAITKVQEIGDAEVFRLLDHAKSVMREWLEEIAQETDA